ncbi:MAG: hypothetical protein AB7U85_06080 [Alphaproteobacteria bacterium]
MKSYKLVNVFLFSAALTVIVFVGVMYTFDPLQLFHKKWFYQNNISNYMREQASGLIRHSDFDSLILGTSVLENTSAKEASEKLGGKFINLSLSGSDYGERAVVLAFALKNKKIKKVIYSLDIEGLVDLRTNDIDYKYLYDESRLNDFYAYTNVKYIGCILHKTLCFPDNIDLDRPNAWYLEEKHSRRFGGLDNWFKYQEDEQIKDALKKVLFSIDEMKKGKTITYDVAAKMVEAANYLNEYLLRYVREYPETEFILVVPPYYRAMYAIMAQYKVSDFEIYLKNIKFLASQTALYPNLKIFGWGNNDFGDDIKNYKDLVHYNYKYNSWILDEISQNDGLLEIKNIDKYLAEFKNKAQNFNLLVLGDRIRTSLNAFK